MAASRLQGAPTGAALLLAVCLATAAATPARAQWTRAAALPAEPFYSITVTGDTVVAGRDSVVYVSTDAGATWTRSSQVGPVITSAEDVWLRHGRLWVGTYGQGVFTSDDLGQTWQSRSDGLAGGLFNSHNYVLEFAERGDSLYAGTAGAGVFVRPLETPGPWVPTGSQLVANQAGTVDGLASDGRRVLAAGGANGQCFRNDGGLPWIVMPLDNSGIVPGLAVTCVAWSGNGFLVGTDHGFYSSPNGAGPWTFTGLNLGSTIESRATGGEGRTFACLNRSGGANFFWTPDDGAHWYPMGVEPSFVAELALQRGTLWAARDNGVWSRPVALLDAPAPEPTAPRVAFGLSGAHPVAGRTARFTLRLEHDSAARLEIFDASGRRVLTSHHVLPAGEHELAADLHELESGIYHARVQADGRAETLRFVRVRS